MTDMTPARLAELRAVAEAAEPMVVFGGLAQGAYVSIEKHELLALIAALEAKTAEVEAGVETERELNRKGQEFYARANRAEAALERVRALHPRKEFDNSPGEFYCDACQRTAGLWPCPTVQATEGADQ